METVDVQEETTATVESDASADAKKDIDAGLAEAMTEAAAGIEPEVDETEMPELTDEQRQELEAKVEAMAKDPVLVAKYRKQWRRLMNGGKLRYTKPKTSPSKRRAKVKAQKAARRKQRK